MRIALATVGTTGDVRPFATLARALVERGHDVTAITWPVHRMALGQPAVRVEVAGPHADPARIDDVAADAATRGPMEQVAVLRDFHLADGEAHLRRLRELMPGHDLVLIHGIHALAHAAVLDEGLRWATVVFDPVLLPTKGAPPPGMPNLGPANRALWWMLDRALSRTARPLDALLARAGSAQRGLPLFRARSPVLHLVACSPSIIRVPPDLPPSVAVTGAWVDRSPPLALPEPVGTFLADGSPPVAISFGSMRGIPHDLMRDAIDRMLTAGMRVVVQGESPGCDPVSSSLLRVGPLDHRALFRRASVVLHHGGAGTTHAATAAGVPSVVVPHVGDQRYWADRLRRLGVAPAPIGRAASAAPRRAQAGLGAAAGRSLRVGGA
ncbi:MAG: nucleotide disphospho-sugar-binding domain-containing protein, partial [Chloroflexota bacterium]